MARIAAVFSRACGAVLDLEICRYAGKGQSELGMLRTLWNIFRPGDMMLADRLMCSWTEMVMLKQRGVDCVCRFTSHRTADFRRGKRLSQDDHIVKWVKPTKPLSIDREAYNLLPDFLMIRETRVRVEQPGFRSRTLIIATTLLDAEEVTKSDLANLYRARWNAELLFQVFADRYERRSLLLTSNLAFSDWGQIFQGERMTAALLDRLTHHCEIFEMKSSVTPSASRFVPRR